MVGRAGAGGHSLASPVFSERFFSTLSVRSCRYDASYPPADLAFRSGGLQGCKPAVFLMQPKSFSFLPSLTYFTRTYLLPSFLPFLLLSRMLWVRGFQTGGRIGSLGGANGANDSVAAPKGRKLMRRARREDSIASGEVRADA